MVAIFDSRNGTKIGTETETKLGTLCATKKFQLKILVKITWCNDL